MSLQNELINNQVRIERIYHLGAMLACDAIDNDVREFLQCDAAHLLSPLLGGNDPADMDDEEFEILVEEYGLDGWIVVAATPWAERLGDSEIYRSSWGDLHLGEFYAPTYEGACEAAIAWAKDMYKRDRGKAA